ncbi:hypothetical protein BASA81_002927 [Batrachochytrium salamandrivorans]|nr:hypothetical protein BASA81_002927 [Batrachochytrium salamandrivorans]
MLLVIPARMGSTRLPGKMLLKLRGNKSILQCTYERVLESKHAKEAELVIATDSREIADEVERFGGRYLMTKASHMSGSERAGEVLAQLSSEKPIDMVVNVQGDEPFLDPRHLDLTIQGLRENLWAHASTVAVKRTWSNFVCWKWGLKSTFLK